MARKTTTGVIGQRFELLAQRHLEQAGLRLVTRNFRTRLGEIDLIMRDGNTLVFVEVRRRKRGGYGSAADSVTAAKRTRLIHAASQFLARNATRADCPCRFDVVTFDGQAETPHWQQAAFDAF